MNRKIKNSVVFCLVTAILLLIPCAAFAAVENSNSIKTAEYTFSDNGMNIQLSDAEGNALLLSTTEIVAAGKVPLDKATILPASYNLASQNLVTSVKNQGSNGNCWAYSSLASLESNYIKNGLGTKYDTDFSESHLTWFTYHSYVSDNTSSVYGDGYTKPLSGKNSFTMGGNFMLATYTMASGMGITTESQYPYIGNSVSYSASDRYAQSAVLSGVERFAESDRNSIKQALINNGAMTLDFCYKGDAYCVNSSYYYSGSYKSQANHAVTLVGWDDNYSLTNFSSEMRPTSNGAWLCKNSWGANDTNTDGGYFWISYSEPSLCDFASFTCEAAGSYEKVYQYDGFGYGSSLFSNNCSTAYAANVFTATDNEFIDSVSFYTDQFNVDYTVYIYTDLRTDYSLPTDGLLACTTSGNESNPGYHIIDLSNLVKIKKGVAFSVVIKLTAKNDKEIYVPVEGSSIVPYNVYYSSNVKNSYVRFPEDATQSTWFDSHNNSTNNVPIKAFTVGEHECQYSGKHITAANGKYTENVCDVCGKSYVSEINAATGSDFTITLKDSNLGIEADISASKYAGKSVSLYAIRDTEYNASRVVDASEGVYAGGSLYYVALLVDGKLDTHPACMLDVKITSTSSSLTAYSLSGNRGAYTSFMKSDASYLNGKYVFNNASCGGFLLCSVSNSQISDKPESASESNDGSNGNASDNSSSGSFMDQLIAFFKKIADFFSKIFS